VLLSLLVCSCIRPTRTFVHPQFFFSTGDHPVGSRWNYFSSLLAQLLVDVPIDTMDPSLCFVDFPVHQGRLFVFCGISSPDQQ
jgi:hypothetical protein